MSDALNDLYVKLRDVQNKLYALNKEVRETHRFVKNLQVDLWKLKKSKSLDIEIVENLDPSKVRRASKLASWTPNRMILAVKRFYTEYKRIPVTFDFENIEWLPDASTVLRKFGSMAALREAAGLDGGFVGKGGAGRGGGWTEGRKRKPFEKSKTHEADNN